MDSIRIAADHLRAGGLIGLPTETVYGLAADARNSTAIKRVFTVKGRPATHPLIVHLGDPSRVDEWVTSLPASGKRLIERFWPGPLTLVLPARPDVLPEITGGQSSVALRMPNHSVALSLLEELGGAVVAPSANRFGHVSPTCARHVSDSLGSDVDFVLDGGSCRYGVESTIVSLLQDMPRILRPGAITLAELETVLGRGAVELSERADAPCVPGSHKSHYAPRTPMRLVQSGETFVSAQQHLAKGERVGLLQRCDKQINRSLLQGVMLFCMDSTPAGYARDLYARLREIDRLRLDTLLVEAPPSGAEWMAVNDRLTRAASR